MVWTTRYLAIIVYGLGGAIAMFKEIIATPEAFAAWSVPIGAYAFIDQYKHRKDK